MEAAEAEAEASDGELTKGSTLPPPLKESVEFTLPEELQDAATIAEIRKAVLGEPKAPRVR